MTGTVVVLGASGLLGQALMRQLALRGRAAVGLSRRSGVDPGVDRGVDLASLTSPQALTRVLEPLAPRLVINAAAITDLQRCEDQPELACALHARLAGLLAAWSRNTGVPWVQVSTDHYFVDTQNRLHPENAPVLLLNQYARSKHAGEQLALSSPLALVARTNIVGQRGWPGQPTFAEWVVSALQTEQGIAAYTDSWSSSMEASQCALALLDLCDLGVKGLLNVAARQSCSKLDFIRALAQALGLSSQHARPQPRPRGGLPRANALGLDVRRAEALLGRHLPTTEEVAATLAIVFKEHEHVLA